MKTAETPVYKRSLFSWVLSGSVKLQLLMVCIILITVFLRVLPLEMQKRIVNQAIKLKEINLLVLYCGIYITAVIVASGLKFLVNIIQTILAQRTTAEMRKALYQHILTLPLNFFRKTQPGMVVSALVTELSTAGDFIGTAIALPITNVLTLLGFAGYLFWLNPLLAAVTLSIYPFVLIVIPVLQKKANLANKNRVNISRDLSSQIAESITGIHEIHGNGSYGIENRKYGDLVEKLKKTRVTWSLYRFAIKVSNNFFSNLSPFIIFILGGYLTINGQLELGSLVAFLSAQEKIYDPWGELIDFYQSYQDSSVSYVQTMQYFDAEPEHVIAPKDRNPYDLETDLEVKEVSFVTGEGIHLLDDINLSLKSGELLALVGFSGSGKSTLASCIGQLYKYTSGHILIDGKEVSDLTKKDIIQNIGFVSQSPFIFEGTFEENLVYSWAARAAENGRVPVEALPSLDDMIAVLHQTGIFIDVLRFGLNTIIVPETHADLQSSILRLRDKYQSDHVEDLADSVEFYDDKKYLYYSSIAGNITFGSPGNEGFQSTDWSKDNYFLAFLHQTGLYLPLLDLGGELCQQTIAVIGMLPPEKIFFEQSVIGPEELEVFRTIAEQLQKQKPQRLSEDTQEALLGLALRFTPGKHKLIAMSPTLEDVILKARFQFRRQIEKDRPGAYTFHRSDRYIHSQTIFNNLFFGKEKTENPDAREKIAEKIIQMLIEEGLLETIIKMGLQYQVGTKGDKLSGGQRQKLAIARAFLKVPRMLILDEATSALDNTSQSRIQNLLETRWKGKTTVVAVVHRLDIIKNYDKIAVMKAGKIAEMGTYQQLMAAKGVLYELAGGVKR